MVVIWPKIVTFVACGLRIGPGPRGQCRQTVFVMDLWCCQCDVMGVNHDQFSHFSHCCPCSAAVILQMAVISSQIVSLVASGLHIGLSPRVQCRQLVCVVELWG